MRSTSYLIIIHVLLVAMAIEIVLLAFQNADLKKGDGSKALHQSLLKPGDTAVNLRLISLDNESFELTFKETDLFSLLFVFNTTCPACQENMPQWSRLTSNLHRARVQILGISMHGLERTRAYFGERSMRYPTYVAIDSTLVKSYRVSAVPLTILLDHNGTVLLNFPGILTSDQLARIEAITFERTDGHD